MIVWLRLEIARLVRPDLVYEVVQLEEIPVGGYGLFTI